MELFVPNQQLLNKDTGLHWSPWATVGLTGLAVLALPFGNSAFVPGAILAIAGLAILVRHYRTVWRSLWTRWILVLMAALWLPQVVALTGAVNFERALKTASTYPLYALSMLPLLWVCRQRDIATPLLYSVLAIAVFWSLDGMAEFVFGSNILGNSYNGRRVAGLFYPDLSLGIVLSQMLPLIFEASRRLFQQTGFSVLLPMPVLSVIVLSGSRAAMLTMLISVVLYGAFLAWHYRPGRKKLAAFVSLLVVVLVVTLWISPASRDRLAVVSRLAEMNVEAVDAATSKRGTLWIAAWKVAMDQPLLGVGVRGFEPAAKERGYIQSGYSHVHLYGLDVLVATGGIGLLAYLAALVGVIHRLWRAGIANPATAPVAMAGGLTIIGSLNPINAHWTIYSSYSAAVAWIFIGISFALLVRVRD